MARVSTAQHHQYSKCAYNAYFTATRRVNTAVDAHSNARRLALYLCAGIRAGVHNSPRRVRWRIIFRAASPEATARKTRTAAPWQGQLARISTCAQRRSMYVATINSWQHHCCGRWPGCATLQHHAAAYNDRSNAGRVFLRIASARRVMPYVRNATLSCGTRKTATSFCRRRSAAVARLFKLRRGIACAPTYMA